VPRPVAVPALDGVPGYQSGTRKIVEEREQERLALQVAGHDGVHLRTEARADEGAHELVQARFWGICFDRDEVPVRTNRRRETLIDLLFHAARGACGQVACPRVYHTVAAQSMRSAGVDTGGAPGGSELWGGRPTLRVGSPARSGTTSIRFAPLPNSATRRALR
jgi:hypothetical protein